MGGGGGGVEHSISKWARDAHRTCPLPADSAPCSGPRGLEIFAETDFRGPVRERGLGRRRAESEDIVAIVCLVEG